METKGEKKLGVKFKRRAKNTNDLILKEGAYLVDLTEKFKTSNNADLIKQAQDKFTEAIKLLSEAIDKK